MPTLEAPRSIVEFATHERFLGLRLYPAQATILMVATLATEAFTDFDHELLARWTAGFELHDDGDRSTYVGSEGISPDVMARIEWCRAQGWSSFREVVAVIGRRGSKNFLAAILIAWQIWQLLCRGDPQRHYGIPGHKALVIQIYGAKYDQAKRDSFADVKGLLTTSTCFKPFLAHVTDDSVNLFTPAQLGRGTKPGTDTGMIRIEAAPTTTSAGRGPAVPALLLDEFAHVQGAGSTADSIAIYEAVRPAMAQFSRDAMILQTSSPWEKTGQLFSSYGHGLAVEPNSGLALHPEILVVQLASWALYEGWEYADQIPMWPGGPSFAKQSRPLIAYDNQLRAIETLDPESFRVEYRAQFAAAVNAYLRHDKVAAIFAPYKGVTLSQQVHGSLGIPYVGHGDPSRSGNNFGFAIAHKVDVDGVPHVVFDVLGAWLPGDFPDHQIDYMRVEDEIFDYLTRFPMSELTFDQYNSAQAIDRLRRRVVDAKLPRRTTIYERTATRSYNWRAAEIFKTAVTLGLVHGPRFELAELELEHLQVTGQKVAAPTTGPVRTDDVADAMINVVYTLLAEGHEDCSPASAPSDSPQSTASHAPEPWPRRGRSLSPASNSAPVPERSPPEPVPALLTTRPAASTETAATAETCRGAANQRHPTTTDSMAATIVETGRLNLWTLSVKPRVVAGQMGFVNIPLRIQRVCAGHSIAM